MNGIICQGILYSARVLLFIVDFFCIPEYQTASSHIFESYLVLLQTARVINLISVDSVLAGICTQCHSNTTTQSALDSLIIVFKDFLREFFLYYFFYAARALSID